MVSEIFELKEVVGHGHASGSALESGISNFLAKLYINNHNIKTIQTNPTSG